MKMSPRYCIFDSTLFAFFFFRNNATINRRPNDSTECVSPGEEAAIALIVSFLSGMIRQHVDPVSDTHSIGSFGSVGYIRMRIHSINSCDPPLLFSSRPKFEANHIQLCHVHHRTTVREGDSSTVSIPLWERHKDNAFVGPMLDTSERAPRRSSFLMWPLIDQEAKRRRPWFSTQWVYDYTDWRDNGVWTEVPSGNVQAQSVLSTKPRVSHPFRNDSTFTVSCAEVLWFF